MPRRKGEDITFLELTLFRIAKALEKLLRKVDEVGEGQDALDAAIGNVQSTADAIKSAVDQAITAINAVITKLQNQPNAPDFSSEITTLNSIRDSLGGSKTELDTGTAAADAAAGVGATPGAGEAPPEPPPTGQ